MVQCVSAIKDCFYILKIVENSRQPQITNGFNFDNGQNIVLDTAALLGLINKFEKHTMNPWSFKIVSLKSSLLYLPGKLETGSSPKRKLKSRKRRAPQYFARKN